MQICLEIVMARHFVALPAFLMQPNPTAATLGVVALDPHLDE